MAVMVVIAAMLHFASMFCQVWFNIENSRYRPCSLKNQLDSHLIPDLKRGIQIEKHEMLAAGLQINACTCRQRNTFIQQTHGHYTVSHFHFMNFDMTCLRGMGCNEPIRFSAPVEQRDIASPRTDSGWRFQQPWTTDNNIYLIRLFAICHIIFMAFMILMISMLRFMCLSCLQNRGKR
nr:hypothetical protein [Brucella gallinifaecis]